MSDHQSKPKNKSENESQLEAEYDKPRQVMPFKGWLLILGFLLAVAGALLLLYFLVIKPKIDRDQLASRTQQEQEQLSPNDGLETIDGVPFDWEKTKLSELGIAIDHPPSARVTSSAGTKTISVDEVSISISLKERGSGLLEDEVKAYHQEIAQDRQVSDVTQTPMASWNSYSFYTEDKRFSFLELNQEEYLRVVAEYDSETGGEVVEAMINSIIKLNEY